MIAGHIEDLIHAAKAMPNGLNRNKMISHLEDARAHAQVLEIEAGRYETVKVPTGLVQGGGDRNPCTCPHYPVAVSSNCPVHLNHVR